MSTIDGPNFTLCVWKENQGSLLKHFGAYYMRVHFLSWVISVHKHTGSEYPFLHITKHRRAQLRCALRAHVSWVITAVKQTGGGWTPISTHYKMQKGTAYS